MNRIRFAPTVLCVALISNSAFATGASAPTNSPEISGMLMASPAPERGFVCVKLTSRLPLERPNDRIFPQSITPYGCEQDIENIWLHPVQCPAANAPLSNQSQKLRKAARSKLDPARSIGAKAAIPAPTVPEPASVVPFVIGGLLFRCCHRRLPA